MQVVHKTACPCCEKPLVIPLNITKPDDKGAGLVTCKECGADVAIRYFTTFSMTLKLARVPWADAPQPAPVAPAA